MAHHRSRRLVIDASVVGAAGEEDATDQRSELCREFLKAIQRLAHRVVLTPAIVREWDRHQSRFARRWRRSMIARRRVVSLSLHDNRSFRERMLRSSSAKGRRAAMEKDLHLIEAAMATDRTIASLDEEARALFREAASRIGEIKSIVWVNPERREEDAIAWLEAGAGPDRHRQLGFRAREGA